MPGVDDQVPATQLLQLLEPGLAANVPAEQLAHTALEVAPETVEYEPGAQSWHCDCCARPVADE